MALEQESHLGTFGIEASGGYRSDGGVVRSATVSYGYLTTSRLSDVRTSSILDYMRHKLSFAAEIRFLRRFSLAVTGTLFDRYGFYNRYLRDADGKLLTDDKGRMQTEEVDFSPYFLLDGHLRWEKGSSLYTSIWPTSPTPITAISAGFVVRISG